MKRAILLLRHVNSSRWNSFKIGLERCGFRIVNKEFEPDEEDILVTWNRFPNVEPLARKFEEAKGLVLVAENGWIKSSQGGMIVLCANHHNGAGWWPIGDSSRWESFGVELSPWRISGERILVLPQRGYGEIGVAMPREWLHNIVDRIKQFTDRQVIVRPHPGLYRPKEPDFRKTFAVVTWASGAAIKALVAGIPVFYEMKKWIGGPAAKYGLREIEVPFLGDRLPMFRKLAHAQWRLDEVESGMAFNSFISSRGVSQL